MDLQFYYGPRDGDLLYNQSKHRSIHVQNGLLDETVNVRRGDSQIWDVYKSRPLHHRVLRQLHRMGFLGVLQCGRLKYDCHLLTALIERWRPETHTFHLRDGEATITLQDVSMIWGLPIQGAPVSGIDMQKSLDSWAQECLTFLGFEPTPEQFRTAGRIKMSAIQEHLLNNPVNDYSPQRHVDQYSRAIAFLTFGSLICPDSTGNAISLVYLQHFHDLDTVHAYSWGSAALANLYRELCAATDISKRTIAGPVILLQIWAWSRIKPMMSMRTGPPVNMDPLIIDDEEVYPPYGKRWSKSKSYVTSGRHLLRMFRHMLDIMTPNQFIWQPYNMEFPEVVEAFDNVNDSIIWRSRCPLICYAIVEMHRPDRVCRQFGMIQGVPDALGDRAADIALHSYDRTGHVNKDWRDFHAEHIQQWEYMGQFEDNEQPIGDGPSKSQEYDEWYNNITRRLLTPVHTVEDTGFQPGGANLMDIVVDQLQSMSVSNRERNRDDNQLLNELLDKYQTLGDAAVEAYLQRDYSPNQPHASPDQGEASHAQPSTSPYIPGWADAPGWGDAPGWADAYATTNPEIAYHTPTPWRPWPSGDEIEASSSSYTMPRPIFHHTPIQWEDYQSSSSYVPPQPHYSTGPDDTEEEVQPPETQEIGERLGRGFRRPKRRGCGTSGELPRPKPRRGGR